MLNYLDTLLSELLKQKKHFPSYGNTYWKKHESFLHHVDWVGPEVMLVSLFHNCFYYKLVN